MAVVPATRIPVSNGPVAPVTPPVTPPAQVVIDNSGTPGSLVQNPPPRLTSLQPADITAQLQSYGFFGTQLLKNAGAPKCGVDFYHFEYGTVGAANEQAMASGGIMVPTGSDPACTGPHPVVLYGHGSSLQQYVNMADISSATLIWDLPPKSRRRLRHKAISSWHRIMSDTTPRPELSPGAYRSSKCARHDQCAYRSA